MYKVRKFAAILVTILVCGNCVIAQNPESYYDEVPRTFFGGLIAGANFTQVDGDRYAGYRKVGLNVGGVMFMHLAPNLAASIEILYSQKGSRSHSVQPSADNSFSISEYNIKLNYAEIPLQLHYFDRRKSHFGAGFSISRLISSDESGTRIPAAIAPTDFSKFPFRKMDYNFVAGGSMHMIKGFFVNLRFQYSLISIRDKRNMPPGWAGRDQQFNNMWTLRLLYIF